MGQQDWQSNDDAYIDAMIDAINVVAIELRKFLSLKHKSIKFVEQKLDGQLRIWGEIQHD